MRLTKRIEALEAREASADTGKPFFWFPGQPLDEALTVAGLTLDDKPLMAIRLHAVRRGEDGKPEDTPDPLYERDKALLED